MAKFDDYLNEVKKGAKALLGETFKKGRSEATRIFETHLQRTESRLKRWTKLLANGDITELEFKLLVNNQVTLGKMKLRTIKVIGKKSAMEFRDKLRALFIDTAFNTFL